MVLYHLLGSRQIHYKMDLPPTATDNPAGHSYARRLPFFYGWIVIAVAFITMAVGVNSRTAFSLLFPSIIDEFGWARGTIAATFSIGFIVSTLMTPVIGVMMDRYGPRVILPTAGIFTSIGLISATFAYEPWHFYLTFGVFAVGGSTFMSYIGHMLFLPNWFDRKRGFALGIAFSGVGIGSIFLFPWMQRIIDTEGWRYSVITVAIVILVVIVPLNFLFQRHRPGDLGMEADGGKSNDKLLGRARKANRESRIVDKAWAETEWTAAKAIRTTRFWLLGVSFLSALYVWYAVQVHQTRYLIDVGISAENAALALGLVGLTGVVGQILIGALSDRVGREMSWTLSLLGYLLTYACLFLLRNWPSDWLMYLMVGLQGFLGYGMASVLASVPADLFAGKKYGSIFGLLGATSTMGAAIGPWATGVFFDIWGNYDIAFIVAMVFCMISIVAMWMAAPRKVILVAGQARKINTES